MKLIRLVFADNSTEVYDFSDDMLKTAINRKKMVTLSPAYTIIRIELE